MAKKESKLKTTKEKRLLACKLTDQEVYQAGQDLANAVNELHVAEQQRESTVKALKAHEAELEARITIKTILVKDKSEMRMVDCENILDYNDLRCRVTRLDTGEYILDRKMTEDEKQSSLPFDGEGN